MMPRRNSSRSRAVLLTKTLLLLLLVYLLSLLYFLRRQPPAPHCSDLPGGCGGGGGGGGGGAPQRPSTLKPWPPLPSFLPWVPSSNPAPRSCEGYFGNGFSRRVDLVRRGDGGGWFRCFHSETLASSICEGGNLRMDPGRIRMSRGGETLAEVMGRTEEDETPRFEPGSFQIEAGASGGKVGEGIASGELLDQYVPRGAIQSHTMRDLISSVRVVGAGKLRCTHWIDEPTLLVTRFEYANLFHTVTDWYSAYVSSRVTNLPGRPYLIFVDGHCKAPLEDTWEALFSSIQYAKNFSSPVCFRHAILSPLGYETAMFKGLTESFSCRGAPAHILRERKDDQKTARLSEFGEMIRAAFSLPVDDRLVPRPVSGHNVLFVRREDYLAHPRHDGKVQSRLSNEQEVFNSLKNWAVQHKKCSITLINGLFAHMPMKDQLRAIQEASVVIGAHGAGLTHLVAASSNTVVLEIISSLYRRPHFQLISAWKGLGYHAINLAGSYAEPSEVVDKLSNIMRSLGC